MFLVLHFAELLVGRFIPMEDVSHVRHVTMPTGHIARILFVHLHVASLCQRFLALQSCLKLGVADPDFNVLRSLKETVVARQEVCHSQRSNHHAPKIVQSKKRGDEGGEREWTLFKGSLQVANVIKLVELGLKVDVSLPYFLGHI